MLFIVAIEYNNIKRINTAELAFMTYASGFTLERIAAMQEHGLSGAREINDPPRIQTDTSSSILQGNMGKYYISCGSSPDRLCRMALI